MKIYEIENHKDIYTNETIKTIMSYAMFNPTEGRVKSAAEGIYGKQQGHFYVAEEEGIIIGIIGVRRVDNSFVEIMHIAVEESARRKGIGTALVKYVDDIERVDQILAETDEDAVKFYRKFGFKVRKTEDVMFNTIRYSCTYTC